MGIVALSDHTIASTPNIMSIPAHAVANISRKLQDMQRGEMEYFSLIKAHMSGDFPL